MESLQAMELDPADDTRPIDLALGQAQESARLMQAVQRLPLIQRQVIVLALEDMDYQEIASVLGISETNVGVRLNRARTSLKRLMGESP
jgi:RNA polymerase sigma-70 factor (ECF subfamily)